MLWFPPLPNVSCACRVETVDGDYMFCFDNTFSTISEKVIFFELILDNAGEEEDQEDWKKYITGTDLLDMKLEDILVRTQPLQYLWTVWLLSPALLFAAAIWSRLSVKQDGV